MIYRVKWINNSTLFFFIIYIKNQTSPTQLVFSVVPRDRNTFQTETHTSSLATYRNNSESSSISAPELEDTRSPLSALSDELVTFRSVLWPALIVLSADRPCNLWPGSTDGHNQQRRVTLIHWGGTAYSGINTHTHTPIYTNIYTQYVWELWN